MKKGIRKIYQEVAPTYELVNHVLTFGMDILWRKRTAHLAAKIRSGGKYAAITSPPFRILDVCTGTGEMARNLAVRMERKTAPKASIYAADGSPSMISRAKNKTHLRTVAFTLANAGRLPFPDRTFDLITISFSTRNLNPSPQAMLSYLQEFLRILKPGGTFLNLETSQPPLPIIKTLYHLYIRSVVKPLGFLISGSRGGYNYLSYTMPRFYDAPGFSSLCRRAGFSDVRHRPLFLGVAAIHTAQK